MLALAGPLTVQAGDYEAGPAIQVSGPSPFADCPFDGVSLQPGINYPSSEIEPSVAVNPNNPDNIVAVWQQDRWSNSGARGIVAGVSQNGGINWTSVTIPGLSPCSGGTLPRVTNPWISFASDGALYVASLPFDPRPTEPGFSGKIVVNKSLDGGLSWSNPMTVEDLAPPFPYSYYITVTDRESITADPTNSNLVYLSWTRLLLFPSGSTLQLLRGPAMFARTTNGGQTWERPRAIYSPGFGKVAEANQIVVLPNGTVINFFSDSPVYADSIPGPRAGQLSLLRSINKGVTWQGPIRVATMQPLGVTDPNNGALLRGSRIVPFFNVTVDRNGRLYAVWQDARFTNFQQDSIAFAMSADGGLTWSTPIKVNKTPTDIAPANQQAWMPAVSVAADGTVAVSYYDFRNNVISNPNEPGYQGALMDYWLVHCTANCTDPAGWGDEIRLTATSFNIEQAPLVEDALFGSGYFLGDFVPLASVGNDFVSLFPRPVDDTDAASIFFRRVAPVVQP